MVKVVKKEIRILGEDNDFSLEITNVKENGAVMKITEGLNAEELKSSLEQMEARKKAVITNINNARDELKHYSKPETLDGMYEIFKTLMQLKPERKKELENGIKNLEEQIKSYETELKELRSAYKRAKKWLSTNKPELVADEKATE